MRRIPTAATQSCGAHSSSISSTWPRAIPSTIVDRGRPACGHRGRLRRRQLLRPPPGDARADGGLPLEGRGTAPATSRPPAPDRFSRTSPPGLRGHWIEQLARGHHGGCGPALLPGQPVTRAQMAVFLLKAMTAPSYVPPAATGRSSPTSRPAPSPPTGSRTSMRDVTGGCLTNPLRYCPATPTTASRWRCSSRRRSGCSKSPARVAAAAPSAASSSADSGIIPPPFPKGESHALPRSVRLCLALALAAAASAAADLRPKVDPWVLEKARGARRSSS